MAESRGAAELRALRRLALRHPAEARSLLEDEFSRNGIEVQRRSGLLKDLDRVLTIHAKYEGTPTDA